MKNASRTWRLLCSATLAVVASCGSADNGDDADSDDTAGSDASEDGVPCTADYPTYHAGLNMTVNGVTATLMSADPAPPRQKVRNDWAVALTDSSGAPMSDFEIETPDTYMPVHRHHGATLPMVSIEGTPGQFKLNALNFTMPGPWLTIFSVAPTNGQSALFQFKICVE